MKTSVNTSIRQTFRVTLDIEVSMGAEEKELNSIQREPYPEAFFLWLEQHPRMRQQLLRSIALHELPVARRVLEAEYGWGKIPEQQFLEEAIVDLGPAAHAYFAEELEDGKVAYLLDEYQTALKHFQIEEINS